MTIKGVVVVYIIVTLLLLAQITAKSRWDALDEGKTKINKLEVFITWVVMVFLITIVIAIIIVIIAFVAWTISMSYKSGDIEPYIYPYLTYFVSFIIFIVTISKIGNNILDQYVTHKYKLANAEFDIRRDEIRALEEISSSISLLGLRLEGTTEELERLVKATKDK